MNYAQLKQLFQNNLWYGEQFGRRYTDTESLVYSSLLLPPTGKVWGIDVSHWNIPPVALKNMKDNFGLSFVIIKACDGSLNSRYVADHVQAAKDAGLPYGLYVWLYPNNRVSIDAQVTAWTNAYNTYKPALGIFIDAEWTTYAGQPANPTATDLRLAHDKLKAKINKTSTTYTAKGYADSYLIGFDWSREPLWVANYGVNTPSLPKGATSYKFWQYTSTLDGKVLDPNANAELDGNFYNGTAEQFAAEYGGAVPPPAGDTVTTYNLTATGSPTKQFQFADGTNDVGPPIPYGDKITSTARNGITYRNDKTGRYVKHSQVRLDSTVDVIPPPVDAPATVSRTVTITIEEAGWKTKTVEVIQDKA